MKIKKTKKFRTNIGKMVTDKQTPSSNFINIDYFNDILRQQMGHWGIITKLNWDTLTKYQHLFSIFFSLE